MDLKILEGKTIEKIECPKSMEITVYKGENCEYTTTTYDDCIRITFTDGTALKLASWDADDYVSGIYKEII